MGMVFISTELYFHQIISVEHFILAMAVMKSISTAMLSGGEQDSEPLVLGWQALKVYIVDLMVDNTQLGFSMSAQGHKLIVYLYLLKAKESSRDMCLLQGAGFHVGT